MNYLKQNYILVPARFKQTFGVRYKFTVRGPDEEIRRESVGYSPNLITDTGLDNVAANNWIQNCYVGTGNTAPSNSDTALVSQVAGTASTVGTDSTGWVYDDPDYYKYLIKTFRFGIGAAEGVLAEVGVGPGSSTLTSRALILDGGGSPTTITVLSDEILDVTAEVRVYEPIADSDSTLVLDSVTYDYTLRAANVDNSPIATPSTIQSAWQLYFEGAFRPGAYAGEIGSITGQPPGSTESTTSGTQTAYTASDHKREIQSTWNYTVGNFGTGGIKSVIVRGFWGQFQIGFDSQASPGNGIAKDNTKELVLEFEWAWARH